MRFCKICAYSMKIVLIMHNKCIQADIAHNSVNRLHSNQHAWINLSSFKQMMSDPQAVYINITWVNFGAPMTETIGIKINIIMEQIVELSLAVVTYVFFGWKLLVFKTFFHWIDKLTSFWIGSVHNSFVTT